MLLEAFYHLLISFYCILTGYLFYKALSRFNYQVYKKHHPGKPLVIYAVTGLILLTAIGQIVVLFFPINIYSQVMIFIIIASLALTQYKSCISLFSGILNRLRSLKLLTITGISITWLLVLVLNAGPTIMDDTESYHIQMIKWIKEYGTVPGLANLHERYGFNSSWFISISCFIPSSNLTNYYTTLNGLISIWLAGYLFVKAENRLAKPSSDNPFLSTLSAPFILILCIVSWPVIRGNASNCNYDLITAFLIFVLFFETLENYKKEGSFRLTEEWIIWPVYLFTVRIINYPLLLLSIFGIIILIRQRNYLLTFFMCFLSIGMILPFLYRNLMLSGYLLYPSMDFDWFNVDWKADQQKTVEILRYIKYFNRVNTGIQSVEVTEALPSPGWVMVWLKHLFTYDKLLLIPGVAGFVLMFLSYKNTLSKTSVSVNAFILVIFLQFISWFIIAPDPRFVYGGILCGILLLPAMLLKSFRHMQTERYNDILLTLFVIGLGVFTVSKLMQYPLYGIIEPKPLPAPSVSVLKISNVSLYIPDKIPGNWNTRCYATELPCLYEPDLRLELRGDGIRDGFRLKK